MNAPYQDPPLPGEMPTQDDLQRFQSPQPEFIAEQPTLPPRQPEGLSFDWGMLAYQSREEFDSKPEPLKRLILDMHPTQGLGIQYSQEQAAKKLLEYQEQLRASSTPEAQLAIAKKQADLATATAEAQAKAAEAAAVRTRITSVLETMNKLEPELDNLVGPLAPAAQMKDKWVNPETFAKRFDLANTTKNEVLEAAKYVKPLSNDERKFLEDMFPKIDDPAPVWRSYFERSRRMLSAGLGDSAPAPQATPQATPPPAQRIIGGQMFELNPQTGKYVPAR
jgi:hypothetical protein